MPTSEELFGDAHVQRYIETDGEEGYEWRYGTKILVLFTKGRKSPAWLLNLEAHPEAVEVQVKGDRFKARPRIATDEEKPRMWQKMVAAYPPYDAYQEKTDRVIPIVVLERA
jgi:deazaflavin-dependent oxidoreductase (nitroreductase family)